MWRFQGFQGHILALRTTIFLAIPIFQAAHVVEGGRAMRFSSSHEEKRYTKRCAAVHLLFLVGWLLQKEDDTPPR